MIGTQADVELVAFGPGDARGGRHRVRPLPQLVVGEDPDRHVLAGLERDGSPSNRTQKQARSGVWSTRRHEGGVVLGRVLGDDAGVLDVIVMRAVACLRPPRSGAARPGSLRRPRYGPFGGAGPVTPGGPLVGRWVPFGPESGPDDARSGGAGTVQSALTQSDPCGAAPRPAASPPGRTPQCPTTATRAHAAAKRYIYAWGDGTAEGNGKMKDLLGGKGAGLAEMTLAGLPTPPGFTITTEACNDYFARRQAAARPASGTTSWARCSEVEARSGKGFGDPANPLLVSVRSGAKFSMPGMMDTVLNLGLNEADARGAHRPVRQRALRLGRLPPVHRHVRPDRDGREGRALRRAARGPQARARPGRQGHRPRRSTTSRPSSPSTRRSSARTPAASSRPTRTSSSTSRSRPSSPPGSASAPTTTATARRSPTTSAPPSTS